MADDLAAAQAAVAGGASVSARKFTGVEPLHRACEHGLLDIAQWLHGEGASLYATSILGTPLHYASTAGHLDIAQWLHSVGADLRATDNAKDTPLHRACTAGHLDVAQWLHNAGASLNATNSVGDGAEVRLPAFDLTAAQAAVADGASVSARNMHGEEPLHLACLEGHLDVARWLHGAGTSLDATTNRGDTPLLYACMKGKLNIAQWLHSVGASLDATDSEGNRSLHQACRRGHLDIAQWLHSAGASLHTTSSGGLTPLHLACSAGRLETTSWLCSAGADATTETDTGNTPAQLLHQYAAKRSKLRAKEAFCRATADLLAAERRLAEERARAAEAALLAEEAAPPPPASKGKAKAKAKVKARAQDGPAPAQSAAGSSTDILPPPSPPLSDAADAALRVAMDVRDLEALKATINQTASIASDAVLKEARGLREQLKERELKAKKQLKREAEAARVHEAREAPARHALQTLLDARGRGALRAALARAEPLVMDFSELLFDAMVAANERLQDLERQLVEDSRAEAKTRHVEEHALRFEVRLLL